MPRFSSILFAVFCSLAVAAQATHAAVVEVTLEGTVVDAPFPFSLVPQPGDVETGDAFSLTFRFDSDPLNASVPLLVDDANETGFEFSGPSYGVTGNIGDLLVAFDRTVVGLVDNAVVDSDETFGLVAPGTYDGYLLAGQSADGNNDLTGLPTIGTHVAVGIYTMLLDTFPDADWYQAPPTVPAVGVDTFMAFGEFNGPVPSTLAVGKIATLETTVVPLPAAGWLMLSVIGLGAGLRRHAAKHA